MCIFQQFNFSISAKNCICRVFSHPFLIFKANTVSSLHKAAVILVVVIARVSDCDQKRPVGDFTVAASNLFTQLVAFGHH